MKIGRAFSSPPTNADFGWEARIRRQRCAKKRNVAVTTNNYKKLTGIQILVVEDDADARVILEWLLTNNGATVVSKGTAIEAISLIRSRRFDVLLSDIGLPEMDGCELLAQVRKLEAQAWKTGNSYSNIPAAAMSAYTAIEDKRKATQAGFSCYLTKPLNFDEVITSVSRLVSQHVAERQLVTE